MFKPPKAFLPREVGNPRADSAKGTGRIECDNYEVRAQVRREQLVPTHAPNVAQEVHTYDSTDMQQEKPLIANVTLWGCPARSILV